MAAMHRSLGLDDARTVERSLTVLRNLLSGHRRLTRPEIGAEFAARGGSLPQPGAALGQLLIIAELRGVICSGPIKGVRHSYALVDEIVPPSKPLDRDDALRLLVRRFFTGHGPASLADFARWSSLTITAARRALTDLADALECVTVDGVEHWFDPDAVPSRHRTATETWLLPVYDEAVLTYPHTTFAAAPGHPFAQRPDPFWAPVINRQRNVGLWKRRVAQGHLYVETRLATSLGPATRKAVATAAQRLAAHLDLPLDYTEGVGTPPLWHGRSTRNPQDR